MKRNEWHTVAELAEIWDCSRSTVYAEIRAGRLRAVVRRGRSRGFLVSDEELRRYYAEELEAVQVTA